MATKMGVDWSNTMNNDYCGPHIYLAGAITHALDGENGNSWRKYIQDNYTGVDWINPLDYESPDMEYTGKDYMQRIVDTDIELINNCDIVLMKVNTNIQTWGTSQEQFYSDMMGTPVVVWFEGDPADLSYWCHVHGDIIVRNMEEAVEAAYFYATGTEYISESLNTHDPYFVIEEYTEWLTAGI